MADDMILQELREALAIPPGPEICRRAMLSVLAGKASDGAWIKANFSYLVSQIEKEAYEIYLREEKPAAMAALRSVLLSRLPQDPSAHDLLAVMEDNFSALDRFFLGLAQGRKPRAGKTFEHVFRDLFVTLGYPYDSQPVINGQPDFLLPSKDYFGRNAMDCIIFTVKRTLRERWRQITTEGTKGLGFFLATIDDKVATRDLPEMAKSRIYLVVPISLKTSTYPNVPNVLSFESFFEYHLDPAMVRWRKSGVIP